MTHVFSRPLTESERTDLLEMASPSDSRSPDRSHVGRWLLLWASVLVLSAANCAAVVRLQAHPLIFGAVGALSFLLAMVAIFAICTLVGSWRFARISVPRLRVETANRAREALARGEARVLRVEATAVVEVEEFEDEGAGYFFQIAPGRVLFLQGQYFDAVRDNPAWPSSVFEIADAPPVTWQRITILGDRLEPVGRIQAAESNPEAPWPTNGDELEGDVETVVGRFKY